MNTPTNCRKPAYVRSTAWRLQREVATTSKPLDQSHKCESELCANVDQDFRVTVLMPCLNESRTLAECIQQAHIGCRQALKNAVEHGLTANSLGYEIVVADNGSTDGSQEIAVAHGARMVEVTSKGYGAALLGGIAAAKGEFIVMADSDCSYDFKEVPKFLSKLLEGYDLVMGNRFAGSIVPGAMPWHHRYLGNPVLSGIGRLLFRTPCGDWHCGLRAFNRSSIEKLQLRSMGMEFASEMVLCAGACGLRIAEIPVILYPDGRNCPPHLRSFRDGWRHLKLMLTRRFLDYPRKNTSDIP